MTGPTGVQGSTGPQGYQGPTGPLVPLQTILNIGNTFSGSIISVSGSVTNLDYISFYTASTVYTPEIGRIGWNDEDGTLNLGLKGGNVTLQIGQEEVIRVVNKTGANLLESQYRVVRIRKTIEGGSQGQRLAVVLAQADNDPNSVDTIGLVTENIDDNQEGFITSSGLVRTINTTGSLQGETWSDGDVLYLSPSVAGQLTNIKPQAPNHTVIVGFVVYSHINQGKIFVKVDNGYELDELHNVRIVGTPSNGQALLYNSGTNVWEAGTVSLSGGGTGVQGSTGPQGFQGSTGPQGVQGIQGSTGSQGNQGPIGPTGPSVEYAVTGTASAILVTGTTSNTLSQSLLIPANSRTAGQVPTIVFAVRKSGGSNTHTPRLYWNTSPSLVGAILIASNVAHAASIQSSFTIRDISIEVASGSGNGSSIFTTTTGSNNTYGSITGVPSKVAIDWTTTGYFIVAIQNASTSDSSICLYIALK
jgi:hypothetical protein